MGYRASIVTIPLTLDCVECGGIAHRLPLAEGEFQLGDVVPFVCEDCDHRHDIVLEGDEDDSV